MSITVLLWTGCDVAATTDGGAVMDASADAGSGDAGEDRDGGPLDAGSSDAGGDSGTDAGTADAGTGDAGETADAGTDSGTDAGVDSGTDAGTDAGTDSGTDAGIDSGTDAGTDSGTDAGTDSGTDAGRDAGTDAGTASCSPDLAVVSDGTSSPIPVLVISEIAPGMFIELFNTTSSPIALSSVPHWFCSPFSYVQLSTHAPTVTVPARGYATLAWPGVFADTDAGGEIILYSSSDFASTTAVQDFVCWGTNPHGSRLSTATTAGKWTGSCASAITSGRSLARRVGTDGTSAASYDTAAIRSPETCAP